MALFFAIKFLPPFYSYFAKFYDIFARGENMKKFFLSLVCSVGSMYAAQWGYDKHNGPDTWAKLDSKFKLCNIGMKQSSINIESNKTTESRNELHLLHGTNSKDIVNNGHTIMLQFNEAGGLVYQNKKYNLVQLHFHTPSETQIEGKSYPMEMHMVHKDSEDNLLVLAVLFQKGQNNAVLNNILSYAPMDVGKVYQMDMIYISQLLPKNHGYYAFGGSLTTPPCEEGVQWIVLKESVEASQYQLDALHAILKDNARGVQPLNDRVILSAP